MENRCQFWLPKKKIFCANAHLFVFTTPRFLVLRKSLGTWVKCPIGPSHSVLEDNLEAHVKKCPLLKQAQSLKLCLFSLITKRALTEGGMSICKMGKRKDQQEDDEEDDFSSEMKRKLVYNLSASQLSDLLCKKRAVHSSICKEIGLSYKMPEFCNVWIQRQVDG